MIETIENISELAELVEEPEKSTLLSIADWVMDICKDAITKNVDIQLKQGLNTVEE